MNPEKHINLNYIYQINILYITKLIKKFEHWCLDFIFIIYYFSLFEIYVLETYRNVL